ncbi:MAG TPA: GIY-YIG nuclease family protein, partial [Woeseiaceae bacterium]|nr:GIY-YIG nuclease family protein [Woeseiaceae bacterium]
MPTTVKSGRAASLRRGVAHLVYEAAIATDIRGAILAARWECGGGSIEAIPVTADGDFATCANCVEAARLPRGPVVYRCYADDGEVIYIGSSVNLAQRIRSHRAGTHWWDEVVRVEHEAHPSEASCRLGEALAIRTELPFYNRDGKPAESPADT